MQRTFPGIALLAIVIVAAVMGGYFVFRPKGSPVSTATASSGSSPVGTTGSSTTPLEGAGISQIITSGQVLRIFSDFEYRYESSNGSYMKVVMHNHGHENVDGVRCIVIDTTLETREKAGEKLERQGGRVWVDEETYKAVKMRDLSGHVSVGSEANLYWNVFRASMMMIFVEKTQMNLAWTLNTLPKDMQVTYLGSRRVSYGSTALKVDVYKVVKPRDPRYAYWEVWVAHLPNGMNIMTRVKGHLSNGGWYLIEASILRLL